MGQDVSFSRAQAFSRNIGWITEREADLLATRTVAIAGVGGVGGHYSEVMARLGVQNFRLADPDSFELVNFNRQNGSGINQIGKRKVQVIRERILDINPEAKITIFEEGLSKNNLETFVDGIDLYLDGLDFFALTERCWLFRRLREKGIPAVTVAPVGMGAALLSFTKDSMSFDDYFGLSPDLDEEENAIRFLVGLTPSMMQKGYQMDLKRVNFRDHRVPSLPMGGYLCAGVAGTQALKLLLGRGDVAAAPWSLHFDAYLTRYAKSYIWLGYRNPFQRLKRVLARRLLKAQARKA